MDDIEKILFGFSLVFFCVILFVLYRFRLKDRKRKQAIAKMQLETKIANLKYDLLSQEMKTVFDWQD